MDTDHPIFSKNEDQRPATVDGSYSSNKLWKGFVTVVFHIGVNGKGGCDGWIWGMGRKSEPKDKVAVGKEDGNVIVGGNGLNGVQDLACERRN